MALWTPVELSMVAWYDASNSASLSTTGGYVTQWNDLSGNDNHATATGSSCPYLDTEVINNLDAILFSDYLHRFVINELSVGTNMFMLGVFTRDASTDNYSTLLCYSSALYRRYPFYWSGSTIFSRFGQTSKTIASSQSDIGAFVVSAERDTTYERVRLNGAQRGQTTTSTLDYGFDRIGGPGNSTIVRHMGYIGELLYFNTALTSDERNKIEGYLAWKWGITLNSGHPYYAEAPTIPRDVSNLIFTPIKQESYLNAALLGL